MLTDSCFLLSKMILDHEAYKLYASEQLTIPLEKFEDIRVFEVVKQSDPVCDKGAIFFVNAMHSDEFNRPLSSSFIHDTLFIGMKFVVDHIVLHRLRLYMPFKSKS